MTSIETKVIEAWAVKAIPIERSNRFLLCDDGDYELLSKHKWHLYYHRKKRRHFVRCWRLQCTPIALLYSSYGSHFGFKFRDNNICNYQRHNIQWFHANGGKPVTAEFQALHCPLGPAILRPKKTDGRSECCFVCMDDDYDAYYQCLDLISHKTYWKGWIRHDA